MSGDGDGDAPGGPWAHDLGLAAALNDGVAVLGPDGSIVWANATLARMLGHEPGAVLGRDGFGLLHPDDVARAFDGVAYASQFPGRASVVPYRLARADGSWLDVELKSSVIERDGGTHVGLVIRDGTARRLLHRALRSTANGEPFATTAALVAEAITTRWPSTGVAVSVSSLDGDREVVGRDLTPTLLEHAAGRLPGRGGVAPWAHTDGSEVAVLDRDELPPTLQAEADLGRFEACGVAPIADPGGEPGCLIVWFDHAAVARLEFVHAAPELTELLGLAIERRHHLWRLWHSARHDELTGLLNRAGFFERLQSDVPAARAEGWVSYVLYLDLDGLKAVNDAEGHAAGDRVLETVARRLGEVVGGQGLIARLGGDEFTILGSAASEEARAQAEEVARRIVTALSSDTALSASIGIALDDGESDPVRLLEQGDGAMYRAKESGRGRWSH